VIRRVLAWGSIVVGAALAVGGSAVIFTQPALEYVAAGGAAIGGGLALLALGIAFRR
jgi:hypothetical protein